MIQERLDMRQKIRATKIWVSYASLLLLTSFTFVSCNRTTQNVGDEKETIKLTKIKFEEESFDFGKIKEGDVVEHKFKFKNIGENPAEILNVQVQCGCTVAAKPENAVGVGQTDEIVVKFNSKGKAGVNKKFVTVLANTEPSQTMIEFTAEVVK